MDIFEYLESREIDYHRGGKNVSRGWIGIRCPFPRCSDTSDHMGINLSTLGYSCWICGNSGVLPQLIRVIDNCSFKKANILAEKIRLDTFGEVEVKAVKNPQDRLKKIKFPKIFTKDFPAAYLKYLDGRVNNAKNVIEKYDLYAAPYYGKFKFRIIIPIYFNRKIVSYVGRDITGKNGIRYKMCEDSDAIIESNRILYNIDKVKKNIIIVEGPFDVFNIGDGAVGLLKKKITSEQVHEILKRKIKRAIIMLDSGEELASREIASRLRGIVPEIKSIGLPSGDPAKLSIEDVRFFRRYLQN